MSFVDGELAGIQARPFRISFSGELSYEIAVPAAEGQAFWDKILEAGEEFGIMPYGTEALHVMRAEKGFIMIGDETDGTVIPQDLKLGWAVSKKKEDFIGKRAMEREFMQRADRKQLVGLLTENPEDVLPDGAHAVEGGKNRYGQENMIGHVTSTYFSPTMNHSIAMALIQGGSKRMGEVLTFPLANDKVIKATVVDPVSTTKKGSAKMSNAVSILNGASSEGAVKVTEAGLRGMITLRGDLDSAAIKDAVKSVVGLGMPSTRTIESGKSGAVAWMSPDELLLMVDYDQAGPVV